MSLIQILALCAAARKVYQKDRDPSAGKINEIENSINSKGSASGIAEAVKLGVLRPSLTSGRNYILLA